MTAMNPQAPQQAVVEAALVVLERMGLSPADLTAVPQPRKPVPTFAEYVPVVSAAVSAGTRRAYGSYWNRITEQWGDRRLDEPTPSALGHLVSLASTDAFAVPWLRRATDSVHSWRSVGGGRSLTTEEAQAGTMDREHCVRVRKLPYTRLEYKN
jgi:aryl-alcohol dehydrogenase-like predicted oxidoreductase